MKCDNKECSNTAVIRLRNNFIDIQVNVCHDHYREMVSVFDLGFKIVEMTD